MAKTPRIPTDGVYLKACLALCRCHEHCGTYPDCPTPTLDRVTAPFVPARQKLAHPPSEIVDETGLCDALMNAHI